MQMSIYKPFNFTVLLIIVFARGIYGKLRAYFNKNIIEIFTILFIKGILDIKKGGNLREENYDF